MLAKYHGHVINFCFRDTLAPVALLKEIGGVVAEDCVILALDEKDFIDIPSTSIELLKTSENRRFYTIYDEDERKFGCCLALINKHFEIVSVMADRQEDKTALIAAAAKDALAAKTGIAPTILVKREDYATLGAALHVGFLRKGYFIRYQVNL